MRVFETDRYTPPRRGAVLAWLLACALLGLAGCGGSSRKHRTSTASMPATSTSTASSTPSLKSGVGSVDAYPAAPGESQTHIRLTLFDVRRQAGMTIVDFGMACRDAGGCSNVNGAFEDQKQDCGNVLTPPCGNNAGGLVLVDPNGNRQYGVVRDAQGNPYASNLTGSLVEGGQPQLAFAVFPPLPAGVSSIDVAFPWGGPTFLDVPVTNGAAPTPATAGTDVQAAEGAGPYSGPVVGSNSTAGMTLPVSQLSLTVGSAAGSDREQGHTATFTLHSDVLFAFNKSNLSPQAHSILSGLASQIRARATGTVQVTGYTDSIGSDAVNLPLSQARAAAVVAALKPETGGVSYASSGKGSADPVAPNTRPNGSDNPGGRALNRRVTIVVPVREPAKPTPPSATSASTGTTSTSASPVSFSVGANLGSYTVAPVGLYRDGNLVVLILNTTCHGNGKGCSPGLDFAGTTTVPPLRFASVTGMPFTGDVPSAVYLTDPSTGDIYPAVTDSAGNPLLSGAAPSEPDGGVMPMWLYFPAPPAGSSVMTVHMPGGSPTMTLSVTGPRGVTVTH